MRPQLMITNAGLTAFNGTNALSIDHFLCGSSYDINNEEIQDSTPFQFDIVFQQAYIKGQQYVKDGVTVTEDFNHIKIMGYLSTSDITFDETGTYTVREIALIGTVNNEEVVLAYGYDEEGITFYEDNEERHVIKLDIICEKTPNISVTNSTGYVMYNDFIDHVNNTITTNNPVHGITLDNGDLKINNNSLDICTKQILQKTTGISVVDTLPTASMAYNDLMVLNNNSLYKCIKSTEIEVGDYIYEDNATWAVGDGTENGALEVVADSDEPQTGEITLTEAQNHFMEWSNVNNINKRLSLVESVSLGGITDIIDNLQNQLNTLLNAQQSPFPAWSSSTSYTVGDICISSNFNSYKYLECVVAGTTSSTMPNNANVGQMVTDNEVKWLVCDWRDSAPVGAFRSGMTLRAGWLKANGATVNRADYPRLWAYAVDNSLTTNNQTNNPGLFGIGNGSTTFSLPNFEDYFVRYSYIRAVGSKQASQMAQHSHSCGNQDTSHTHLYNTYYNLKTIKEGTGTERIEIWQGIDSNTSTNQSASHKHAIGNTGSGSNTYPDNITMEMYIKY